MTQPKCLKCIYHIGPMKSTPVGLMAGCYHTQTRDMVYIETGCDLFTTESNEQRDANGWRPIETAPKDGTNILLYVQEEITTGNWDEIKSFDGRDISCWGYATLDEHGCGCCSDKGEPPTHWMPLPAPPLPNEKT